eukprot:5223171-Prymnesium_polylepis.1
MWVGTNRYRGAFDITVLSFKGMRRQVASPPRRANHAKGPRRATPPALARHPSSPPALAARA